MKKLKEVIHTKEDYSFSNEYSKNNIREAMVTALNLSKTATYKNNKLKFVSTIDNLE